MSGRILSVIETGEHQVDKGLLTETAFLSGGKLTGDYNIIFCEKTSKTENCFTFLKLSIPNARVHRKNFTARKQHEYTLILLHKRAELVLKLT